MHKCPCPCSYMYNVHVVAHVMHMYMYMYTLFLNSVKERYYQPQVDSTRYNVHVHCIFACGCAGLTKYQLDLTLSSLHFSHHPLFSLEHVMSYYIRRVCEEYSDLINTNNSDYILQKVLYCTVLYCTVLYSTVLYCTVQHCTALYCTCMYNVYRAAESPDSGAHATMHHSHACT